MKPIVFLISTTPWISPARLAMALAKAGCTVRAICPAPHPLRATSVVDQISEYRGLAPLPSILRALSKAVPDLVIPTDDLSARHLHEIYFQEKQGGKAGDSTCALIERSLGAPANFPLLFERTTILNLAQAEGVRVPKIQVVENISDLNAWISNSGFPIILKANGTTGGVGVRVVRNLEEAQRALGRLQAPVLLARAAKRALLDSDLTLIWPSIQRKRFVVNAQVFVAGREATSIMVCDRGKVLAALNFEVIQEQYAGGPATVLKLIENSDMVFAAEKMASRLQLSGLHGLDFMLEGETGHAHLIELNPRATQVGHLLLGPGRDLPAAVVAMITGERIQAAPRITEKDCIALFPQEWRRDPASTYLQSSFHDVPWEEPGLIHLCIKESQKEYPWFSPRNWAQAYSKFQRARS